MLENEIKKIVGNNIFGITFLKKDMRRIVDGKLNVDFGKRTIKRDGIFRLAISKKLKGGARTTVESDYLIAYDMRKGGYRNIFYSSILKIVANKNNYYIGIDKNKRFMLVDGMLNKTEVA